jgi:hypothetical protein
MMEVFAVSFDPLQSFLCVAGLRQLCGANTLAERTTLSVSLQAALLLRVCAMLMSYPQLFCSALNTHFIQL